MSSNLDLPDWASRMPEPPVVTRYAGPEDKAVQRYGRLSRTRYRIECGGAALDLNEQQADALGDMLIAEFG